MEIGVLTRPADYENEPACTAKHRRTVRRSLRKLTLQECHEQKQSPIFGKLPAELRNRIFDLVLETKTITNQSCGITFKRSCFPQQSFTMSLLRTCRLAYLETRHLPIRKALQAVWAPDITSDLGESALEYGMTR